MSLYADTVSRTGDKDELRSALRSAPMLTIVGHPNVARIGERIALPQLTHDEGVLELSRATPVFQDVTGEDTEPLACVFLSRKPVMLRSARTGIEIDTSGTRIKVHIAGTEVVGTMTLAHAVVHMGVVLRVGDEVVLLLSWGEHPIMNAPPRHGILGDSAAIVRVRSEISRIASDMGPVLIRGETGSGKELIARAIHDASPRSDGPYVPVNMAAIPSTLAAAEFFGHTKNAFSGAGSARQGYFGQSDTGSLFLDEVGDTPMDVQALMLRAIDQGEVQPLGSEDARKIDVRVIAATDADLATKAREGLFRPPLYYRLASHEIHNPPLRERRDDVARLLVGFLVEEMARRGRESELATEPDAMEGWLSGAIIERLVDYPWPGNVRQLRNVCRYLAGVEGRPAITDPGLNRLLDDAINDVGRMQTPTPATEDSGAHEVTPSKRAPADIQGSELEEVLKSVDYRLTVAAKLLGISRPSLNRLVDAHPTLVRAQKLTKELLEKAFAEHEGDIESLWRALQVGKRSLQLRLRELGIAS